MGDEDFDAWFDDAAQAENAAQMQNQAAKFDEKNEEERTRQEGAFGPECALAGQFFCKFENEADPTKTYRKAFSGHIVKKEGDDTYVALTAAHCLHYNLEGNIAALKDGFFFLQKNGTDFAAKFYWTAEDVKFYDDYDQANENPGLTGQDVAAIKLTLKETKTEIPEVVELSEVEFDVGSKLDGEYTMSGYPEQSIRVLTEADKAKGEQKLQDEGKHLFRQTGEVDSVQETDDSSVGAIVAFSMDASKGQDGGALTNADGKVVAIYSNVETVASLGDKFYCATIVSSNFISWFEDLSF